MGCGRPKEFPTWCRTLGAMVDNGTKIRVICTRCRRWRDLDLAALAERAGRDYSLIDRRCKCRLTAGCPGWNRFFYLLGVYRPLWHPETGWRWSKPD